MSRMRALRAGTLGGLMLVMVAGLPPGSAVAQGFPWPGMPPGYGELPGAGSVPGVGGIPGYGEFPGAGVPGFGGFPGPGGLPGFGGYPGFPGLPGYGYPGSGGPFSPGGFPGFGPGGGSPGSGAYPGASGSGGSPAAATPTQHVVLTINDFYFLPAEISFPSGTQISWSNRGQTAHTSTSVTRGQWDSGNINAGSRWSATFSVPGTYEYYCTLHPEQMRARLTITAS